MSAGGRYEETFPSLREALDAAQSQVRADHPDDDDGTVYICRDMHRCRDALGHCADCLAIQPGDRRSLDDLIAAYYRRH